MIQKLSPPVTNELNHYFDMKLGELDGEFTKFNDEYGVQLRQVDRNVNKQQRFEVLLNQDCKRPICGETVHLQDDSSHRRVSVWWRKFSREYCDTT